MWYIVAGVIEATSLHLVGDLGDETRLELRICGWIAQRQIPFVQERLRTECGVLGEQRFHAIDSAANARGIAVVDVPRNKVQRRLAGLAEREQRRQDVRAGASEGRTTHTRLGVGPHDGSDGVLIVARVVFRREEIRAAAAFADIGLVRDFTITNARAARSL